MENIQVGVIGVLFSQFSAAMAAVAFTALVLILTFSGEMRARDGGPEVPSGNVRDGAASLFFVSFTAFAFAQQAWNMVGGEEENTERAYSEIVVADLMFALAFVNIFFGIQFALAASGLHHSARLARLMAVIVLPPVAFGFMYGDLARIFPTHVWATCLAFGSTVYIATVLVLLYPGRLPRKLVATISALNLIVLTFLVAVMGVLIYSAARDTGFLLPGIAVALLMAIFHLLTALYAIAAFAHRFQLAALVIDLKGAKIKENEGASTDHSRTDDCQEERRRQTGHG
ncbi:hypothetical protein [Kineosporia babensis]|uniref:Uncharacterized protein n=1 Tax=Kineosporia babensis TaxID=499548 RepID=A0A9X1NMQ7_9ACTN|nr:hypothetical protein [Kineosporia babensis]MCD5317220.1 hypothetical protein [Kineosporia babensis]